MHVTTSYPPEREHTMTQEESTQARSNLTALMSEYKHFRRQIVGRPCSSSPRRR